MGYPADEARGALRLSLGRITSDADVATASAILADVITRQRKRVTTLAGRGDVVALPVGARGGPTT
jgi:cysteine sulfinate desulfinase/cysteine desulfurase-like protein